MRAPSDIIGLNVICQGRAPDAMVALAGDDAAGPPVHQRERPAPGTRHSVERPSYSSTNVALRRPNSLRYEVASTAFAPALTYRSRRGRGRCGAADGRGRGAAGPGNRAGATTACPPREAAALGALRLRTRPRPAARAQRKPASFRIVAHSRGSISSTRAGTTRRTTGPRR